MAAADDDLDEERAYAEAVGRRLRRVRQEHGLTLADVDRDSDRVFKESALSAYERGDRNISVLRLHQLANFYRVPVDSLLPPADGPSRVVDLRDDEDGSVDARPGLSTAEIVREVDSLRAAAESILRAMTREHAGQR